MKILVLASTSPYRMQLMRQLGLPFHVAAPQYQERISQDIAPELLVKHQAAGKARSLAEKYPDALIVGSDQVFVDATGRIVGKPAGFEAAVRQLRGMVGKTHTFYTGLSVYDSNRDEAVTDFTTFRVTLRPLSEDQIRTYLLRENPLDCAGAFKIEGLGIALMQRLDGEDYTALIGLPLIKLVDFLAHFGVRVLGDETHS
ncbi:MAG: Maf family protein [Syntrophotalea acetylenica]|jgi:septum formation protein|uniref:7-methyl-GTP pyrophosphatase n=1 Tax=Syntrophotalea acetylenica TaxID=29542 RepID=A0A1L3GCK7_SYNAC|nr:nucleoside triphosphate pyrophosphatase [Syntrophotalea acetylenica]APG23680.1 septum formation protein Maf [Syntrophotalea acetylenica]APG44257.1 septum formation protein Maf [Syntrophotalea acetylenica]MDD4456108.1 Maf family protein [Syntrophotalea acetylenica]MDY0262819.1 nucleoside triphosphate pyrophosphatase [Syntrophotalea acetylenica]